MYTGAPGFAYPNQPVMIQHQALHQNAPMGYTTQAFSSPTGLQQTTIGNTKQPIVVASAPPIEHQQATVPQPQGAPSGEEKTSSQKESQGQGGYVKLEEDH